MGHADALSGRQFPYQKRRSVRRRRRQGDRRRPADQRPQRPVAVQASGDQARGAPGHRADRRDSGIAVGQRVADLRRRLAAVPHRRLC